MVKTFPMSSIVGDIPKPKALLPQKFEFRGKLKGCALT